MTEDDPLLSVAQIARIWGTGLDVVISLVQSETLPSLDRGEMIARGHLDVPLIRRSWAEFLSRDVESTGRVIEPPEGQRVHPAVPVALGVHSALGTGDADALYELSSAASRKGRTPEALLARWNEINRGGYPENSGVGTTIYSLAPIPAVAARVFADAPMLPRAFTEATPASLIAVLPFVDEGGTWKVDLPIYDGPVFLPELLTTPMPEDPEDSDSLDGPPDPAR